MNEERQAWWSDSSKLQFALFCWVAILFTGLVLVAMYGREWFAARPKAAVAQEVTLEPVSEEVEADSPETPEPVASKEEKEWRKKIEDDAREIEARRNELAREEREKEAEFFKNALETEASLIRKCLDDADEQVRKHFTKRAPVRNLKAGRDKFAVFGFDYFCVNGEVTEGGRTQDFSAAMKYNSLDGRFNLESLIIRGEFIFVTPEFRKLIAEKMANGEIQ